MVVIPREIFFWPLLGGINSEKGETPTLVTSGAEKYYNMYTLLKWLDIAMMESSSKYK